MFLFSQDLTFVDTLVNLAGVAIECLDFSTPGLFAMATTTAGKSPNTTPTKWNKRLQKPMGNFTSVVNLAAKLLLACERTRDSKDSKVTVSTCHMHVISLSFFKLLVTNRALLLERSAVCTKLKNSLEVSLPYKKCLWLKNYASSHNSNTKHCQYYANYLFCYYNRSQCRL